MDVLSFPYWKSLEDVRSEEWNVAAETWITLHHSPTNKCHLSTQPGSFIMLKLLTAKEHKMSSPIRLPKATSLHHSSTSSFPLPSSAWKRAKIKKKILRSPPGIGAGAWRCGCDEGFVSIRLLTRQTSVLFTATYCSYFLCHYLVWHSGSGIL